MWEREDIADHLLLCVCLMNNFVPKVIPALPSRKGDQQKSFFLKLAQLRGLKQQK